MEKSEFRKGSTVAIIAVLLVLSFFLLKPLLIPLIFAIILAFLFSPLYKRIYKIVKSKNISAFIICLILAALIITPLWLWTPALINKSVGFYMSVQDMDFVTPLKNIFPSIFSTETFAQEVGQSVHSFVSKGANSLMNSFADIIKNFPVILLQSLVMLFAFFFLLKDQNRMSNYVKSILPFTKKTEKEIFKASKGITVSVILGQIVMGILQGLLVGASFFIFNVPNAFTFTLLACLLGVFPIIGPMVMWVPMAIYLLATGSITPALGVILFGLLAMSLESFVKPVVISKRTNLHPAVVLVGMVGGLFFLGVIGIILGPLILAYLLIILDIYRDKKTSGFIIDPKENKKE